MMILLQFLPLAFASGLITGVAGSRDLKRGVLRGLLNGAMLSGGLIVLAILVTIANDPTILGGGNA